MNSRPATYGEVLRPRGIGRSGAFSDENLEFLARVLDDWFRIPGTSIRFGIDGIIGLVPGIGDLLSGLASTVIVIAAWARGVPMAGLLRMMANIGIDVVVGAIPFIGDAFDIAWKANRRNYELLTRHITEPRRHTWKDWVFLFLLGAMFLALLAIPVIVTIWLLGWLLGIPMHPVWQR